AEHRGRYLRSRCGATTRNGVDLRRLTCPGPNAHCLHDAIGHPMPLIDLANPSRFRALTDRVLPWLGAATVLAFARGLQQGSFAPDDYQQGATVKIMFLHVPSAWLSMMAWGVMSLAALGTLVWRHPLADVAAKSAAPLGAAFTLLCLITGSLW